ncbi:MAG: hypothetical protein FJY91_03080 [Candidatus Harrisonbacteria bacterium]|nr:hypothetical protein [Candidatus Harrisonbacteria bacterium]
MNNRKKRPQSLLPFVMFIVIGVFALYLVTSNNPFSQASDPNSRDFVDFLNNTAQKGSLKPNFKTVYNCTTDYSTGTIKIGYGYGLKKDSYARNKINGFGYGYCMNYSVFNSYGKPITLNINCLNPNLEKVYLCQSNGYFTNNGKIRSSYCIYGDNINTKLNVVDGITTGYGYSKTMGLIQKLGKCQSYEQSFGTIQASARYYLTKYVKSLMNIK